MRSRICGMGTEIHTINRHASINRKISNQSTTTIEHKRPRRLVTAKLPDMKTATEIVRNQPARRSRSRAAATRRR